MNEDDSYDDELKDEYYSYEYKEKNVNIIVTMRNLKNERMTAMMMKRNSKAKKLTRSTMLRMTR